MILGRTKAQTLFIGTDDKGLWYKIPPGTSRVHEDVRAAVTRRDVTGSSFGFTVSDEGDSYSRDDGGRSIRTIRSIDHLFDVGPVTFPAYEGASSEANCLGFRAADGLRAKILKIEILAKSREVAHTLGAS